jgi:type IV pilus assembly protein PilA
MSGTQPNKSKGRHGLVDWASLVLVSVLSTASGLSLIGCGHIIEARDNELAAIKSLREITQAQAEYDSAYPAIGFACGLKSLGGVPGSGAPTSTAAQLLDNDLASSGYKSGYNFKISNCERVTVKGADRITGYLLTAVPASPGKTGNRGFCTDEFGGNPKYDPAGGTNCTQSLQ